MDIGSFTGQPMTIEQANPLLYGMVTGSKAGADFANSIAKAQQANALASVAPQMAQQSLQEAMLNNRILSANAQYAPQNAQASAVTAQANEYSNPYVQLLNQMHLYGQGTPGQSSQNLNPNNISMMNTSNGAVAIPNGVGSNNDMSNLPAIAARMLMSPGQLAQQSEQGKLNAQSWQNLSDQSLQDNKSALDMTYNLNNFKNAYDKAYFKGSFLGKMPATGGLETLAQKASTSQVGGNPNQDLSNEQLADTYAGNLQAALGKSLFPQRLTDSDLNFIKGLKVNRAMDSGAVNELTPQIAALQQRTQQESNFYSKAREAGIDPKTAQNNWTQYNNDNPIFDPKTGKPISYNPNLYNSYAVRSDSQQNVSGGKLPITQQQALGMKNAMQNAGVSLPQGLDKAAQGNTPNQSTLVVVQMPDGKQWHIPQSKLAFAMQRGGKQIG